MHNCTDLLSEIKKEIESTKEKFMSDTLSLDYTCLITMDDCSQEGGYRFSAHGNSTPQCHPTCVLSVEGHKNLLDQHEIMCPVCYTNLTADDFTQVGPRVSQTDKIFVDGFVNPFEFKAGYDNKTTKSDGGASGGGSSSLSSANSSYGSGATMNKSQGVLVMMKGTVGAGKTTFSQKLQEKIEAKGWKCINEGVDKYCRTGMQIRDACVQVRQTFQSLNYTDCSTMVVILDTCGEPNVNYKKLFDHDFSNWSKITVTPNLKPGAGTALNEQYMAWSLRNVLNREMHESDSSYWLNPYSAGVDTCVSVHAKKCKNVFGKKTKSVVPTSSSFDKSTIMDLIQKDADDYQTYLDKNIIMDDEVEKQMIKIGYGFK
jgi:hypothetical protein